MNPTFALLLSLSLVGCNAYRTTPDSEILFSKKDLAKKGFVMAPVIDNSPNNKSSIADLNAYDATLHAVLSSRWPDAPLLSTAAITRSLDSERLEAWRKALQQEDQTQKASTLSPSTVNALKGLAAAGIAYPSQVLLSSIMQNSFTCGQKEALSPYLATAPQSPKAYCQRVMKMRFRILDTVKTDIVWNGIVYATQESTQPLPLAEDQEAPLEPPTTQALMQDCFHNFARQFNDK